MNELAISDLVEVFEVFGLKKKHARNLVVNAVMGKQWQVINSRVSVMPVNHFTLEKVALDFLQTKNIPLTPVDGYSFKTSNAQEFYELLINPETESEIDTI